MKSHVAHKTVKEKYRDNETSVTAVSYEPRDQQEKSEDLPVAAYPGGRQHKRRKTDLIATSVAAALAQPAVMRLTASATARLALADVP